MPIQTRRPQRTLLVAALAAGFMLILQPPPATAAEPALKCEANKLKQAGKYAGCRFKTEAKALKNGTAADFAKCNAKLTKKWESAEAKAAGACPITGDLETVRALITAQTESVVADLGGGAALVVGTQGSRITLQVVTGVIKCQSLKLKAAGKYETCLMKKASKAWLNALTPEYEKCHAKVLRLFTKADGGGECPTTEDGGAVRLTISTQAGQVFTAVGGGACGNGVLDAGEQCDGSAAANLCASGNCSDTCKCKVCCELPPESPLQQCSYHHDAFSCSGVGGIPSFDLQAVCSSDGTCSTAPLDLSCCPSPGNSSCAAGNATPCEASEPGWGPRISNSLCTATGCDCAPTCAPGQECGSDGCGGTCGTCAGGAVCQGGICVCTPDCVGRVCGDDGCGGSCGPCGPGFNCHQASGTCVSS